MARLEDLLPPNTEAVWSCGHVGGACCKECYRQLALAAADLAKELHDLREELDAAVQRRRQTP